MSQERLPKIRQIMIRKAAEKQRQQLKRRKQTEIRDKIENSFIEKVKRRYNLSFILREKLESEVKQRPIEELEATIQFFENDESFQTIRYKYQWSLHERLTVLRWLKSEIAERPKRRKSLKRRILSALR